MGKCGTPLYVLHLCRVLLCKQARATYPNDKLRRKQMRAAYFSAPAIRSLRSIPFYSVLKAGGFSRAGIERAWRAQNSQPTVISARIRQATLVRREKTAGS